MIATARASEAWATRDQPLEIVLQTSKPLDPIGDPQAAIGAVRGLTEAGATIVDVGFVHRSPTHYVEQLEALVDLASTG